MSGHLCSFVWRSNVVFFAGKFANRAALSNSRVLLEFRPTRPIDCQSLTAALETV